MKNLLLSFNWHARSESLAGSGFYEMRVGLVVSIPEKQVHFETNAFYFVSTLSNPVSGFICASTSPKEPDL